VRVRQPVFCSHPLTGAGEDVADGHSGGQAANRGLVRGDGPDGTGICKPVNSFLPERLIRSTPGTAPLHHADQKMCDALEA
jgi:hypothetical protein